jgi:hypothetical protein
MPNISTRTTRYTLDANRTISTGSIKVFNIIIANASAGPLNVPFTDADGTALWNIVVPANSTEYGPQAEPILCDNGLLITSVAEADCIVTVFHSQDGA